jgi:hypothetical protein
VTFLARPWPYAIWAALVVVALPIAAYADPYIFAFTSLFGTWITGAIAIVAVAVTILAKGLDLRARAAILGPVLVAGAALALAFARLSTYHWA